MNAEPASLVYAERRLSLALRSGAAVGFAIAFFWPSVSGAGIAGLFAAYLFVDGALALAPGGWGPAQCRGWPLLAGGCIDMAAAGFFCFWPGIGVPVLIEATGIWAIAFGATMALACATLREADPEYQLLLAGIAALVLGRALLPQPAIGAVVLSAWMGLYALTLGFVLLKLVLPQHYRELLD